MVVQYDCLLTRGPTVYVNRMILLAHKNTKFTHFRECILLKNMHSHFNTISFQINITHYLQTVEGKLLHLSETVRLTGTRERLLRTGGPLEAPLTAVWGTHSSVHGGQICTPASLSAPKARHSVRVSPSDNYSSNMELAIEALIRMKMSQLASYQSISGESRFKQDIKDGGTVSSLFLITPTS